LTLKKYFYNFFLLGFAHHEVWRPFTFLPCYEKANKKNQGFILSFSSIVRIIFACKIATIWVVLEPRSPLLKRFPHFAA